MNTEELAKEKYPDGTPYNGFRREAFIAGYNAALQSAVENKQPVDKSNPNMPLFDGEIQPYNPNLGPPKYLNKSNAVDVSAEEIFKRVAPNAEKLLRITSQQKYKEVISAMHEYASIKSKGEPEQNNEIPNSF